MGQGRDWRPDDRTFGARLALVRQHMGWGNVREAALACGVPSESWRSWERDGRTPRDYARIVMAIHARTGVDAAWLAGVGDVVTDPTSQPVAPESGTMSHSRRYLMVA
jgi:hypothetical protein